MNRWLVAVVAVAFSTMPAYGQQPGQSEGKKELTAQQKRMQQCNVDAKKRQFKDNEARQAFMRLPQGREGGAHAAAAANGHVQQGGIRQGHEGDERKKFMSECLKG